MFNLGGTCFESKPNQSNLYAPTLSPPCSKLDFLFLKYKKVYRNEEPGKCFRPPPAKPNTSLLVLGTKNYNYNNEEWNDEGE